MLNVLTGLLLTGLALADDPLHFQGVDSTAMAVALTHARTVVPEGWIQVSPDTVAPEAQSGLEAAARIAGFHFGHDHEAVDCGEYGACFARGSFRGLVHIVEYERPGPDRVVVTLRVLQFTPQADRLYEQVDEIHVERLDARADWEIRKVVRITES